ncbi:hypothetical protein LOTGIDRAFT_152774 [Lottia gigantea]|uniref:Uncharacterized protein n=1 Tax=Lottia gigantea TaxID=225164 RepID=V4C7K8_LOTGI|nr:hypothetical protein LOTGIDRAFT_152774 [Lottia gigantea]ESO97684.1 hypothetical protein LOTGIDRAFT_152774 [Lottia gigantea]
MARLTSQQREQSIGRIHVGQRVQVIPNTFNCSILTIERLWIRYNTINSTDDRPRSGPTRVTTPRRDRYILRQHLHDRFTTDSSCNDKENQHTGPLKRNNESSEKEELIPMCPFAALSQEIGRKERNIVENPKSPDEVSSPTTENKTIDLKLMNEEETGNQTIINNDKSKPDTIPFRENSGSSGMEGFTCPFAALSQGMTVKERDLLFSKFDHKASTEDSELQFHLTRDRPPTPFRRDRTLISKSDDSTKPNGNNSTSTAKNENTEKFGMKSLLSPTSPGTKTTEETSIAKSHNEDSKKLNGNANDGKNLSRPLSLITQDYSKTQHPSENGVTIVSDKSPSSLICGIGALYKTNRPILPKKERTRTRKKIAK